MMSVFDLVTQFITKVYSCIQKCINSCHKLFKAIS